jgi:alkylhydroperoxidase family enzyme
VSAVERPVSASGSGSEGPRWHELPDRTEAPGVRRARRHRALIALAKRLTRGRSYQFLRVLSINPRLLRPFLAFNARLMPFGKLDRRQTEALILRTARLCGSRYEWTQHRAMGREAGLTEAEIEAIGSDPEGDALDPPLRDLLRIVPELLDDHTVSEATFERLSRSLSPAEILEAVVLVGNYAMLAGALNSFGVPLERAWES